MVRISGGHAVLWAGWSDSTGVVTYFARLSMDDGLSLSSYVALGSLHVFRDTSSSSSSSSKECPSICKPINTFVLEVPFF